MKLFRKVFISTIIVLVFPISAHTAKWTFFYRASVQEQYSDNIFLSTENEQDDFITTLSAGLTARVTGKKGNLGLTFTPAYVMYDEFNEADGWRLPVSLKGRWDMTKRTRLDFTDNFLYTEDPVPNRQADPLQGGSPSDIDTTERRGRQPYLTNRAQLRLTHQFDRRDKVYIEYINRLRDNDDTDLPATDREDSSGHALPAGLTFWMTPQWGLDFEGLYARGYFDQPDNFVGIPTSDFDQWYGSARLIHKFTRNLDGYFKYAHTYQDNKVDLFDFDYQIYEPSIGVDYRIEEDIELLLSVGYFFRDFKDPNLADDNTGDFTLNANLIKKIRRGSFRLNASGGYDFSYFGNQNEGFTRYGQIGYGVNYRLFKRIRLDSYGYYRRNEFLDNLIKTNNNIFRFTAGLAYIPLEWMSIRLAYSFRLLDSNIPTNEYTENRGLLTVSFSPEQPYRILQ